MPSFSWFALEQYMLREGTIITDKDKIIGKKDTHFMEDKKCVLLRFASKKKMTSEVIAHEALHATMFILDYIGECVTVEHQEHAAYLLQWVVRCCEEVKLGKTEKE